MPLLVETRVGRGRRWGSFQELEREVASVCLLSLLGQVNEGGVLSELLVTLSFDGSHLCPCPCVPMNVSFQRLLLFVCTKNLVDLQKDHSAILRSMRNLTLKTRRFFLYLL